MVSTSNTETPSIPHRCCIDVFKSDMIISPISTPNPIVALHMPAKTATRQSPPTRKVRGLHIHFSKTRRDTSAIDCRQRIAIKPYDHSMSYCTVVHDCIAFRSACFVDWKNTIDEQQTWHRRATTSLMGFTTMSTAFKRMATSMSRPASTQFH